jgi:hypothetical protein
MVDPIKLDVAEEVHSLPSEKDIPSDHSDENVVPRSKIPWFRSTRFQAAVLGGSFFCGPGMYYALTALGAGGLESATLVNTINGISFGLNAVFAFFSGIFINFFGVRLSLSLGLIGFSIYGAALYCNNRFGTVWLLYFSSVLQGYCTAVLWYENSSVLHFCSFHRTLTSLQGRSRCNYAGVSRA